MDSLDDDLRDGRSREAGGVNGRRGGVNCTFYICNRVQQCRLVGYFGLLGRAEFKHVPYSDTIASPHLIKNWCKSAFAVGKPEFLFCWNELVHAKFGFITCFPFAGAIFLEKDSPV